MKNTFKTSTLLLIAMALSAAPSCTKDASKTTVVDANAITFTETISSMATKATDTAFEAGDEISVTAYDTTGAIYESNVVYAYDGSVFSSSDPIRLGNGDAARLLYRAMYPVAELTDALTVDFAVQTNQSTATNYTLSDLMTGVTSYTSETSPELSFSHILTKMVFTVSSTDVDMDSVVSTVNASTGVSYDIASLECSVTNSASAISMADNGINSYKAIIVPQSYSAGDVLGAVTVNGVDYEVVLENDIEFVAGVQYTYYLHITGNSITYTEPQIQGWDEVTINDSDQGTPDNSVISENSYGHLVGKNLYMDGRSNGYGVEDKSFLDLDSGVIYHVCDAMENAGIIDMMFYDPSSSASALRGPSMSDSVLGNYQCNGTSLTELYPDYDGQKINDQVVYFRVLNPETTLHANLIAAFAASDNISLSSKSSLISGLATPSSAAPNIISEVTTYDGKNFDADTYNHALLYRNGTYGVLRLNEIKFNATSGVSAISFDYIWGN